MRRLFQATLLTLALPLAGCFDMDVSVAVPDADHVEMKMVMTASPEFYAMASGSGEDLCETGVGQVQDDGSYVCTDLRTGSIEEVMADPDMSEGIVIEKRDGGLVYVAFELGSLTDQMALPEEAMEQETQQMLMQAFAGHSVTISIAGAEIVETNGTKSDDGTSASFEIPLTGLLDNSLADLPETFNALVKPES